MLEELAVDVLLSDGGRCFGGVEPADLQAADEGQGYLAGVAHTDLAGEVGLVEDGDLQEIAGADEEGLAGGVR